MAEELYGLTQSDMLRLRELLSGLQGNTNETLYRRRRRPMPGALSVVGLLTDSIAATTALTSKPKVGTLNVYSFTSTGVEDTGVDVKIYNFAPQAATTDRWTFGRLDAFNMKYVLDFQACS